MKYIFKFPRCDTESIVMDGETYGEAADKAIAERTKHITPLKADGEIYEHKSSLVNPLSLSGHADGKKA